MPEKLALRPSAGRQPLLTSWLVERSQLGGVHGLWINASLKLDQNFLTGLGLRD